MKVIKETSSDFESEIADATSEEYSSSSTVESSEQSSSEESESGSESTEVNIDFEFFDLKPEDSASLRPFMDILVKEKSTQDLCERLSEQIGSCVKVDNELYAFCTCLTLEKSNPEYSLLQKPLKNVAWIISERMVNLPVHITPPLIDLLIEELEDEIGSIKQFKYILVIASCYFEVESKLERPDEKPKKKRKTSKEASICFFKQEEEFLEEYCSEFWDVKTKSESDSKRAFYDFGVDLVHRYFLLKPENYKEYLQRVKAEIE